MHLRPISYGMKSIAFCSSQRFKNELQQFIFDLKKLASEQSKHIVILDPEFEETKNNFHLALEKDRVKDEIYRTTVAGRVYDHLFRKVLVADTCFIFNKDGYLGANTNGELFAAAALGKHIYALNEKTLMGNYPNDLYEEPSSRKLIHEIVNTPAELLTRLM